MQDNGNSLENYAIDFGNINFTPKTTLIKFKAYSRSDGNTTLGWICGEDFNGEWDDLALTFPKYGLDGKVRFTFRSKSSKNIKFDIDFEQGLRMTDVILDKIILIE